MNQSNMYSINELERTGNFYWKKRRKKNKNRYSGVDL